MKYKGSDWKRFIKLFTALSKVGFTDVIIRKNQIREINASKNLICTINNVNSDEIEFQMVKNYLALFSSFTNGDDTEIEVTSDKTFNYIRDNVSEVKIIRPDIDLLSCDHLDDARFSKLGINNKQVMLETELDSTIINKANVISELFASGTFVIDVSKKGKAKLKVESWKKTGSSRITTIDSTLPEVSLKGNIDLFRFGSETVNFQVVKVGTNYLSIASANYEDFPVELYSILNT